MSKFYKLISVVCLHVTTLSCKILYGTEFCPRWAVQGSNVQHSALQPGTWAKADPSAQHSKSIKYVIRKPQVTLFFLFFFLFFFFYLDNIINHYLVKFNMTMCIQLPTGYLVKYDIHSKPERIVW